MISLRGSNSGGEARRRPAEFTGSALSDLAFLLIIYFLVISGFDPDRGFSMTIEKSEPRGQESVLRFGLDSLGGIWFDGKNICGDEALSCLRGESEKGKNVFLLLNVSPGANWQQIVSFVDMARSQGIMSFSFEKAENLP